MKQILAEITCFLKTKKLAKRNNNWCQEGAKRFDGVGFWVSDRWLVWGGGVGEASVVVMAWGKGGRNVYNKPYIKAIK